MFAAPLRPAVLLVLAGSVACSAPSPADPDGDLLLQEPTDVTLAIGKDILVGGTVFRITFESVPRDNRCAVDVVCINDNDFEVGLRLWNTATAGPLDPPERTIVLEGHRATTDEGLRFEVVALSPEPRAGEPIDPSRYVVRLRVSP